jgi:lambda family phage tail tape measure protein
MERAFMSMVDGTKSAKDAFRDMARSILAELYRVLVVQRLVGMVSGPIQAFSQAVIPSANGNAFQGGNVVPFANGGVVSRPTLFPMMGGRTGLMGEAGPEAIMPLKRGRDGKLGVQAESGNTVHIVQNFSVAANGDESVKRIVAQQVPAIAEATKAAVIDARQRGGKMRAAFR